MKIKASTASHTNLGGKQVQVRGLADLNRNERRLQAKLLLCPSFTGARPDTGTVIPDESVVHQRTWSRLRDV